MESLCGWSLGPDRGKKSQWRCGKREQGQVHDSVGYGEYLNFLHMWFQELQKMSDISSHFKRVPHASGYTMDSSKSMKTV